MTINGSTNSNSYIIWLDAYESAYSVANNTSTVVVELYMKRTIGSYPNNGGSYNGTITVDGSTQTYSGSLKYPTPFVQGESKKYATLTFYNIGHNPDGSKTVNINATYNADFLPTSGSAGGDLRLTTIPRASNVGTLSGYIESQSNIAINPYASFSHSVRIYFGNINKWLQSDGTLGNNEYIFPSSNIRPSFVIPTEFYSQFTSERGVGTIYVNTYSGGTKIGENHNTLTAICNPALCNPFATATVFDVNSKTLAITKNKNDVIRYQSIMEITPTITVSGVNDTQTTLKSKSINGTIFTTDTARVVNPTDKSFTLKLVNSRNMSSEIIVEASGELIPYIPLTFSANLWRTEPTTGEVEIEYSGNYFAKNFKDEESNTVSNVLSLFWKYREKGTEDWIDGTTLEPTIDTNNNTYSGSQSLGTIFDYRKQYEFIVLYSDKLMEQTSSIYPVSRGFPIFWWSEDAVHIMNKLYVGDSEIGSGEIFSTEEKVIGKTDNGYNVYKKIIESTTNSVVSEWKNIVGDIREVLSFNGTLVYSATETKILPFSDAGSRVWFQLNTGTHYLQEAHNSTDYNDKDIKLVLIYTKTTDQGTEE